MRRKTNHSGASLRSQGYNVLPVKSGRKHCHILGWNDLDDWEGESPGLGLNLVGLVMIDFDVDNVDSSFIDDLVALAGIDNVYDAPWRYRSNTSRIAILMRCEDVDHLRFTTRKWPQGKVEFKIGRGEFLFGWGVHPSGAPLGWVWRDDMAPVESPDAFIPKADIPKISLAALRAWRDAIDAHLESKFGPSIGGPVEFEAMTVVHDLSMDMVFKLPGDSTATLEDLYKGPGTSVVVNLTPWRPDSDSEGGHICHSYMFDGPSVTDFVTGTVHMLPDLYDVFTTAVEWPDFEGCSDFSDHRLPQTQHALSQVQELGRRLNRLIMVREHGMLIYADDPTAMLMSVQAALFELPPKDRADVARSIPCVDKITWDPRKEPLTSFYDPASRMHLHNCFKMPEHRRSNGTTLPFRRYMTKFIPDEEERNTLWNWLAFKTRQPSVRGFAIVLVGPEGSGKGTFWRIIGKLWGERHVSNVGGVQTVYEAKYHDVLFRKLYVLIDEVSADDRWRGKRAAQEALKAFCEPQASTKVLNIKGQKQVMSSVCASVGFATNNRDGLPLAGNDRRFFVAETGEEMPPHAVQEIHTWADNPANIAELWHELSEMDLGGFNPMRAPMSQAKTDMANANESDVDILCAEFIKMVDESGGFWMPRDCQMWLDLSCLEHKEISALKRQIISHGYRRVIRYHGESASMYLTKCAPRTYSGAQASECIDKLRAALEKFKERRLAGISGGF